MFFWTKIKFGKDGGMSVVKQWVYRYIQNQWHSLDFRIKIPTIGEGAETIRDSPFQYCCSPECVYHYGQMSLIIKANAFANVPTEFIVTL